MCHHNDGHVTGGKIFFKPFNCIQIKVVRWLIQNNKIWLLQKCPRNAHSLFLSTRKVAYFFVKPMDAQLTQNLLYLKFIIPRVQFTHLTHQVS